ncbi:hypothetical protein IMSAGC012_02422 [Lachnospiraceae bacterium]|nr:hypothetical protein IMSAGC012_02422 [Lachnospiraceae bacterium]
MELVKLTHENLDREHICCAISNNKDIQVIFFAVDNDRIVGIIDFRHTLNDFLKDLGHCGYSVRPSERRKGFATEMLRQLLEIAKKTGMNELHLSVERKNEPAVKTIIRNGGVYERSFEIDGEQADIYRIALSE